MQATCTDHPTFMSQMTIVFIRHLFNKESKKEVAAAKTIQTLEDENDLNPGNVN